MVGGTNNWGALCGIIPNSFIVQLKSASPGSFREVMPTLTAQLAAQVVELLQFIICLVCLT